MNKIFFDNNIDFINTLLKNNNNTGVVYCDSFRMAFYIRNEILEILFNRNELKENYTTVYNNSINTIVLKIILV